MEVRILGPLEVAGGQGPIPLPKGRARALLAQLALRAGEVVSADRLIDELWGPSPPPTAHTALQVLVSKLRKRIEPYPASPTVLVTREPGYVLSLDRELVDAHRFRRQVSAAVQVDFEARASLLRDALGLWRGPALHDFSYEPFAQAAIADLEETRLTALEQRIEADLALGRHGELVAELERLTAEHPLRERLRGHLMLAQYRCGRQADALRGYGETRQRLVDELGIEPGQELRQLHRAILSHDPAAAAPPGARITAAGAATHQAQPAWFAGGRKIVTVLFADLSPAGQAVDLEAARLATRRAYEVAVEVLHRHGGTIEGFLGDVVVAVFGLPTTHEDDALRAVRAGHELRTRLAAPDPESRTARPACRIGIESGEVLVGGPSAGPPLSGQPMSLAAKVQQAAADGEVLVGEATLRLVGQRVRVAPADGPAVAWRVVDLPEPPAVAVPPDVVHVGRAAELGQLRRAYRRAVRERRAVLVTVLGEPGLGKSRLAREFARTVAPAARVVTGQCPSYGEGITFWPLREIVQALASGADQLSELLREHPDPAAATATVACAVGLATELGDPAELFGAVRAMFEAIARQQPLVLVFEDLHWAQPTLLDLIEHVAESIGQPLLLLCLARPELTRAHPRWAGGVARAVRIPLAPLTPPDSERLLSSRMDGRLLPAGAVERVVALAQGNPLFLEQLLAALRDDLRLDLPPTLQALLTARLDRLGPAERDLLRCASVVGLEVPVVALTALLPDQARPHLQRHLRAVEDRELITMRHPATGEPPAAFQFRHVLIQRAAYGTLTRRARWELHERFADWLDQDGGGRQGDLDELVGHHLEQAFRHRRQLGPPDAAGKELARRAGERLAGAGLRAYARFDVPAAENLLSRARALLPGQHPVRPEVLRRLTEAYPVMGKPEQADAAFTELLAHLGGDAEAGRGTRLERARFRLITGPDPVHLEEISDLAEQAMVAYHSRGDHVGMSRACYVLAHSHLRAGRMSGLARMAWKGLAHAERSGDTRERLGARWWPVYAMMLGPAPVPACVRDCGELVDVAGVRHPGVLAALGLFTAMTGDLEQGRARVAQARQIMRERIRLPRPLTAIGQWHAAIETLAGDMDAAEHALRPAFEIARQIGERDEIAQIAASLSVLLARRGEGDEAATMAAVASTQAPAESVIAQALARAARARTMLVQGTAEKATRLIQEAIGRVPPDMLNLRAQLHLVAAEILADPGNQDDPARHIEAAVGLYRRKGNIMGAHRAAALAQR